MNTLQASARGALEALRSGVPSRHAVEQLGTTQAHIRTQFESSLAAIASGEAVKPLVLSATFGGGKSHLLNYLKTLAASQGFVTSIVVVGPEMPLGMPHVVLKAIADAAEAPGRTGRAIRELSSDLSTGSSDFAELRLWAREAGLEPRFPALLHLFEEFRADEEFRQRILGDFEGNPIPLREIRARLKDLGQAAGYALKATKNALLAHDRIRLLAHYFRACRCKGWVILFDELERFPEFAVKQRLAAWVELGWWEHLANSTSSAILPVFAIASGHIDEAITKDAPSFRASASDADIQEREDFGRRGIALLNSATRILSPTREQDEQILFKVKAIYEEAYGVTVAGSLARKPGTSSTIRSEIRRWITNWDLQRYYPDYTPAMTEENVEFDSSEIGDHVMAHDDEEAGS